MYENENLFGELYYIYIYVSFVNSCLIALFQILKLSKFLLLETASPDSIVRLRNTKLVEETKAIKKIYFEQQHHHSINDFLTYQVHSNHRDSGLLMQV